MSQIIARVPDHSSETGYTEINLTTEYNSLKDARLSLQDRGYVEGIVYERKAEGTAPQDVLDLSAM